MVETPQVQAAQATRWLRHRRVTDPQLSVTTGRFTVEILEFQQRGDDYADRRERKYDEVDYRQRETLD